MRARILHESRGRMRICDARGKMTIAQADLLQAYLESRHWCVSASVHERTGCAIIRYREGERACVVADVAAFSYSDPDIQLLASGHSARELNRYYEEKLVGKCVAKAVSSILFPKPLRIARCIWHSVPFIRGALRCLRRGRLKVEILDALSIGVSMARGDFGTAGSVMFLLEIGELLEEWTHKRSVDSLARTMSLNVDRAWVRAESGEERLVPVAQIREGDTVIVRMGGVIPVDGVVCGADVMVNQASLTGESEPVVKRAGTTVYAGMVVEEGECVLTVTHMSGGTRYDRIVSMIEESERLKSSAESKAAGLADRLVPWTLLGSAAGYLLTRNVTRALSVLMVDFSCALKLAMPLAVLSAMRECGAHHITVKGGKFLEAVAQADAVVFDKTGTLTRACPEVVDIVTFGGKEKDDMLRLAACLEEHFPHSMANAVVRRAQELGLSHDELHSKVEYIVAHGISSRVGDETVQIGSAHFIFEDEGCEIPADEREAFDAIPERYSHLYMSIAGRLAAVICISDPLREEAGDCIRQLRSLGISSCVMLTGDSRRTAGAIAAEVGVDDFRAEVLPEDKAAYVQELRARGHTVIMVGDGINDSPALSAADAGVAISSGAAIAREIADITVSEGDLSELVTLRQVAMRLMARIKANYRFVIGFNGGLIALGLMGLLQPAAGATLHNLSTLGVSLHSMTRLLPEKKEAHRDEA